jgi:serine/threonine protein kinase
MQENQAKTIRSDAQHTDAQNWQRLQDAFHLLQQTPAHERHAVLDASIEDAALRERVRALLLSAQEEEKEAEAPAATAGKQFGSYALLRYLGSGGLGTVYLTERLVGGAVQPCAIKLLSAPLSHGGFRARFEREQQILASLNHPNITHLLDAGVSDNGQPYLVMEFVDGQDLSLYCDQRRLSVAKRVALFVEICAAVAYAHRSLIVHLDLKPSNVMVTGEGTVKLLDFGTSKLIGTDGTMTATVLGTPAYSSPEQLRGEPVTTMCDLYSLGAMLYELLSGQRPFETTSVAMAVSRAAQEQEPHRITTAVTKHAAEMRGLTTEQLRQVLAGDLASIVARCLRSRPQDRYGSVDALTEDLRRYLEGRPVLARRQTATYRLTKFGRRHRGSLAVTAVALVALISAAVFSYQRQQHALREGHRAEQMQLFMSQLFRLANQQGTGNPAATLPEFLRLGVSVLPEYIQDPADRRAALLSLGKSMADGIDMEHALPVFQQVAASAKEANDVGMEAQADALAGTSAHFLDQTDLSDALTAKALALSQTRGVGVAVRVRAQAAYAFVRLPRKIERDKSLALLRSAVQQSRATEVSQSDRLWVLETAANFEAQSGELQRAEEDAREAAYVVNRQPRFQQNDRAAVFEIQGMLRMASNDPAGSIPLLQQASAAEAACCGVDGIDSLAIKMMLGRSLLRAGHPQETIALLEPTLLPFSKATNNGADMAVPYAFLAEAYLATGQAARAEEDARRAIGFQAGKVNQNSARSAMPHLTLARALHAEGKEAPALTEADLACRGFAAASFLSATEKPHQAEAIALATQLRALQGMSTRH